MSKPVLTLEALADWCERKPADEAFDWLSDDCAVAQYAAFLGMSDAWHNRHQPGSGRFWADADVFVFRSIGAGQHSTFGKLSSRLRAVSQP